MQTLLKKNILLALILLFLTLLTRASHELTSFSLPDASLAIFIDAGIFLKQRKWLLEDIGILEELNYGYMSMMSGRLVEEKQLQSPSFLPFNLSIAFFFNLLDFILADITSPNFIKVKKYF